MQINLAELEISHNPAENRFETWIEGRLSKLDYLLNGGVALPDPQKGNEKQG